MKGTWLQAYLMYNRKTSTGVDQQHYSSWYFPWGVMGDQHAQDKQIQRKLSLSLQARPPRPRLPFFFSSHVKLKVSHDTGAQGQGCNWECERGCDGSLIASQCQSLQIVQKCPLEVFTFPRCTAPKPWSLWHEREPFFSYRTHAFIIKVDYLPL